MLAPSCAQTWSQAFVKLHFSALHPTVLHCHPLLTTLKSHADLWWSGHTGAAPPPREGGGEEEPGPLTRAAIWEIRTSHLGLTLKTPPHSAPQNCSLSPPINSSEPRWLQGPPVWSRPHPTVVHYRTDCSSSRSAPVVHCHPSL